MVPLRYIKDMTREEQLAYWQRKNEGARQKYPKMRELKTSASH